MEGIDEGGAASLVEGAHAADVADEVARAHEVGEDLLKQIGGEDIHGETHGGEAVDEVGGDDDVAEAHGGAEYFAEGSDVDDAVAGVEALERGDGHALETVFAVVVVFDDPGGGLAGPLE